MSTSEFTKYMIAKQFKALLKNHDFHNISVHMIVSNCHISRNTFYYHFQDKYDVIKWIFYSESASIFRKIKNFISRYCIFKDKTVLLNV